MSMVVTIRWTVLRCAALVSATFLAFSGPFAPFALATPIPGAQLNAALPSPQSMAKRVHVIGQDDRRKLSDFAREEGVPLAEIHDMVAATGMLICGSGAATAQVTGSNRVITSVAHVLFDQKCSRRQLHDCYFEPSRRPAVRYPIVPGSVRMGLNPDKCLQDQRQQAPTGDWSVIELKNPVENVRPYLAPDEPVTVRFPPGTEILQITGGAANFKAATFMPAHAQRCRIRDVGKIVNVPLQTDCDTGHGSSGSAQLMRKANGMVLVAINALETSGTPDGADYDPVKSFNISVPVSETFLSALREAVSTARIPANSGDRGQKEQAKPLGKAPNDRPLKPLVSCANSPAFQECLLSGARPTLCQTEAADDIGACSIP
jgi:hypothetical protein